MKKRTRNILFIIVLLSFMIIPLFVEGASLTINPLNQDVPPGSTVSVTLDISGVEDMYGWQFSIGYDGTILSLLSVSAGPFLGTGGSTFWSAPDTSTPGEILSGTEILTGAIPGVNGSGTLLHLHFNAVTSGISSVTIFINASDPGLPTELIDSKGSLIAGIATNGRITVAPEPEDADGDGIFDDGDISGIAGDNPCKGGNTQNCDDNCLNVTNPDQEDIDSDGMGNACDACPNHAPARIKGTTPVYYATIWEAYSNAANDDTIQCQEIVYDGDFDVNQTKPVKFEGGYNCDYLSVIGSTTISGNMTVSNGVMTIEDGVLEVQ